MKLRLGYPTVKEDIAALHAVRKRLGGDFTIMVDYKRALTVRSTQTRPRLMTKAALSGSKSRSGTMIAGNGKLARTLKVPIQIGAKLSDSAAMAAAIGTGAADYVMPDLERIGGVTGWQRAAALAASHGIDMSSHLFPEVSARLLAATPTCHWLEWVDWAEKILTEPLRIVDGHAIVPERPGNGLVWNKKAVEKYRM